MKHIIITFLLVVNTCLSVNFRMDYSVFRYNDSLNLLELYYSFPDNSIAYSAEGAFYSANLSFKLDILKAGAAIDSANWNQVISSTKNVTQYSSDLVGLKVLLIPKGSLLLKFSSYDAAGNQNKHKLLYNREFSVDSRDFNRNGISLSDIQIASAIEKESHTNANWNRSFLKNSLFVIPNPGADLIGDSIKLNCYFEIYNARKNSPKGVDIIYTILDAGKKEVFHYPRMKKAYSDAMVEYVSIPVSALPTGVYYLQVDVLSSGQNKINSDLKKFYVSNFTIPPKPVTEFYESQEFEQSEFATLSDAGVETHYDQIKQIANDYELGVWDKCTTLGAKQRYLFAFWAKRNPDTTKPYNTALEKFREEIDYANQNFKYGLNTEGWRTPRGRILIKYGHPTLVDRHSSKGTQPAYEIWKFDEIQGGVEFVFIDIKSNGYYQMVHSNAMGEMYNDNWYEQYIEKQDPDPNFKYNKNQFR